MLFGTGIWAGRPPHAAPASDARQSWRDLCMCTSRIYMKRDTAREGHNKNHRGHKGEVRALTCKPRNMLLFQPRSPCFNILGTRKQRRPRTPSQDVEEGSPCRSFCGCGEGPRSCHGQSGPRNSRHITICNCHGGIAATTAAISLPAEAAAAAVVSTSNNAIQG